MYVTYTAAKPKLGRNRPSTGSHASRGPRVEQSCLSIYIFTKSKEYQINALYLQNLSQLRERN